MACFGQAPLPPPRLPLVTLPPCPVPACLQGTVLIRSAEELENYSKSEEARIEEVIKSIAGGCRAVGVQGLGGRWMAWRLR